MNPVVGSASAAATSTRVECVTTRNSYVLTFFLPHLASCEDSNGINQTFLFSFRFII